MIAGVRLQLRGDLAREPDERATFVLPNLVNGVVGGTRVGSDVMNHDAPALISVGTEPLVVAAGDPAATRITVALSRRGDPSTEVTGTLRVFLQGAAGGEVSAADLLPGQFARIGLRIAPYTVHTTLSFDVADDRAVEPVESFFVAPDTLNGAEFDIFEDPLVTIVTDDEPPPTVEYDADPSEFHEDDHFRRDETGATAVTFAFTRVGDLRRESRVDWKVGGTVSADDLAPGDFGRTGTVVFAPGETLAHVRVGVLPDGRLEDNELLMLELSNPVEAVIDPGWTCDAAIVDDDAPASATLSVDAATLIVGDGETVTPVTFWVTRLGDDVALASSTTPSSTRSIRATRPSTRGCSSMRVTCPTSPTSRRALSSSPQASPRPT